MYGLPQSTEVGRPLPKTQLYKKFELKQAQRDASAANDNVLDNFEQIFRHYSPDTIRKII